MKKLIAFLTLASTFAAYSQGWVIFQNKNIPYGPGGVLLTNARISYGAGGPIAAGSNIAAVAISTNGFTYGTNALAALYTGPIGVAESAMQLLVPAVGFRTGSNAGYVNVGTSWSRQIDTLAPGAHAWVQVRAWDSGNSSASYEEAAAKIPTNVYLGKSEILQVTLGGGQPPLPAPNLVDERTGQPLQPFALAYQGMAVLSFATDSYLVNEGESNAMVTIIRTSWSVGTVSVDYTTIPGTAIPEVDYVPVNGTISFADGETNQAILIPILDDSIYEGNETLQVLLSNPSDGSILRNITNALLTIVEDDLSIPIILTQPLGTNLMAGETAVFSVNAVGTGPLFYQWQRNNADLPGAISNVLLITNVQAINAGIYTVSISNSVGVTVSEPAPLDVNFLLALQTNGYGLLTCTPAQTTYRLGTAVTLLATNDPAHPAYDFLNWSGTVAGNQNPLTLIMETNHFITGHFVSTVLYTSVQGVGTVLKNPDRPYYRVGDLVLLTARTSCWWYAFSRWSDGLAANPRTVTIGANNSYTAIITNTVPLETNTYNGVTRIAPVGMPMVFVGTDFIVSSPYTNRGPAQVRLTSTFPAATILYTLDGSDPLTFPTLYTGPFLIQRSARLRVVAIGSGFTDPVEAEPIDFVLLPTLTVTTAGGGTVAVEPPDGPYLSDNSAIISCYPSSGWTFLGWLGDATGPDPIITLAMTRNKCVAAVFGTTITTNVAFGSGGIFVDPAAGLYPYGSRVRLTAVPSPGFYFFSWAGAVSGTNNPISVQITSPNPTIRAMFVVGEYALTVIPIGNGRVQSQPYLSRYALGQSVTNTAIPDSNQMFLGWSGDTNEATILNGTNLIVSMNSNRVITANFTSRPQLANPNCCPEQNADGYQFRIQGHVGEIYEIQVSSNLTDWVPLTTLTNSTGVMSFTDSSSTNLAQRLYRAILP